VVLVEQLCCSILATELDTALNSKRKFQTSSVAFIKQLTPFITLPERFRSKTFPMVFSALYFALI